MMPSSPDTLNAPSHDTWLTDRQTATIRCFIRMKPPVELDDLATQLLTTADSEALADIESDAAIEQRKVHLHHFDLPRLAAHGFLTYDHEQQLITESDTAEREG